MRRSALLVGLLLVAPASFAQTSSTDSQTLQALLAEVRQLRQQLQTYSAAAQRTQILFFRIQSQQALVERASQRAEEARTKLADLQQQRKSDELSAKADQDQLEHLAPGVDRQAVANEAAFYKRRLEELPGEEQQRQAKLSEAEEQLRAEQAKLDDLNSQLDQLDKALQKAAAKPN
jgi:chromosome segregation protein